MDVWYCIFSHMPLVSCMKYRTLCTEVNDAIKVLMNQVQKKRISLYIQPLGKFLRLNLEFQKVGLGLKAQIGNRYRFFPYMHFRIDKEVCNLWLTTKVTLTFRNNATELSVRILKKHLHVITFMTNSFSNV